MTMTTAMTYTELFAVLVADLEITIKRRKNDAGIRFAYDGTGYDVGDRTERMALIERISDDYVKAHADVNQRAIDAWEERGGKGERPVSLALNTALLDRLSNAVLDEELTDPNPHKVLHAEYPFFSDVQLDRRRFGARGSEDTNMKGEVTLDTGEDSEDSGNGPHNGIGSQLATDGRSYRLPIRRTRSKNELILFDENAKIHNKRRAAKYKDEIAPGKIVCYNLKDTGGELLPSFVNCVGTSERLRQNIST